MVVAFAKASHPSKTATARATALFVTGDNTGPSILELLVYTGWGADIATCFDLCRDTRVNPNLWLLADAARGRKRRTRLMRASATGDVKRLREMLAFPRVDVNRRDLNGLTALSWASSNGHLPVVCELLDRGAFTLPSRKPDDVDVMPLHAAALAGHAHVVREPVARGADVNVRSFDGWQPLMSASYNGRADVVMALLDLGADVNARVDSGNMTSLMLAATKGNMAAVCALLAAPGIDIDLENIYGRTALFFACERGHLDVVRALLNRGASARPSFGGDDFRSATPLSIAATLGHMDVVREFLARGTDINAVATGSSRTPLMLVATAGSAVGIAMLVECGADVNVRTPRGTALVEAATFGQPEAVDALLAVPGIDLTITTRDGVTALQCARIHGHPAIAAVLAAAMAH